MLSVSKGAVHENTGGSGLEAQDDFAASRIAAAAEPRRQGTVRDERPLAGGLPLTQDTRGDEEQVEIGIGGGARACSSSRKARDLARAFALPGIATSDY